MYGPGELAEGGVWQPADLHRALEHFQEHGALQPDAEIALLVADVRCSDRASFALALPLDELVDAQSAEQQQLRLRRDGDPTCFLHLLSVRPVARRLCVLLLDANEQEQEFLASLRQDDCYVALLGCSLADFLSAFPQWAAVSFDRGAAVALHEHATARMRLHLESSPSYTELLALCALPHFRDMQLPIVDAYVTQNKLVDGAKNLYCRNVLPTDLGDGLFLSGAAQVTTTVLARLRIRGLVSVGFRTKHIVQQMDGRVTLLQLDVEDDGCSSVAHLFEQVCEFAAAHRNVLIHCHQGISRSVVLAAAVLIRTRRFTMREAMHFILQRRIFVQPKPVLCLDLQRFEWTELGRQATLSPEVI
jgi:hypothetical protein